MSIPALHTNKLSKIGIFLNNIIEQSIIFMLYYYVRNNIVSKFQELR